MAVFSDTDKVRIRRHLRYPQVQAGVAVAAGVMFAAQSQFILEHMMDNVIAESIPQSQKLLDILDAIDQQFFDANERLQVTKADVVTFNPDEHSKLAASYKWWQQRLCDTLSVPVNPNPPSNNGVNGLNFRTR